MAYGLSLVSVEKRDRVAFATVSNPPINIITLELYQQLMELSVRVAEDDEVSVLVLKSADPDFFLAHFDVSAILEFPTDTQPERGQPGDNAYHEMCERFRTMPKVTIAQIEGRVGGGGSELVSSFDMRYGVRGKTKINQMEVPIGILPGGCGTQRLPRLVGRGRALEIIMGGEDLDAETAERWGYLNRIFAADEIDAWVTRLALRIGSFPAPAVRAAKLAVNASDQSLAEGLVEESYLFQTLLRTPEAPERMRRFLELGGQTREGELRVGELSGEVNRS